jgi:hypothetical protein
VFRRADLSLSVGQAKGWKWVEDCYTGAMNTIESPVDIQPTKVCTCGLGAQSVDRNVPHAARRLAAALGWVAAAILPLIVLFMVVLGPTSLGALVGIAVCGLLFYRAYRILLASVKAGHSVGCSLRRLNDINFRSSPVP